MADTDTPHNTDRLAAPPDSSFRNQRVTVMGLGRFGGGAAAARFLAQSGARVTVTDLRSADQLSDAVTELHDVPIAGWRFGEHRAEDVIETDLLVVNPAVPPHSPWLQRAIRAGTPLSSEIELFCERVPARIVGITGSNGKSTTTALIHHILQAAGRRVWLGGNIGRSLLSRLPEMRSDDWVVLELSSFQLAALDRIRFRPHIAVVTNFTPNHLDWHADVAHYRWAKQRIMRWQRSTDWTIVNARDTEFDTWSTPARRLHFGGTDAAAGLSEAPQRLVYHDGERQDSLDTSILEAALRLPGLHNRENVLAALAATCAAGVPLQTAVHALPDFKPLAHRLEFVGEHAGRVYINDSLATTPESAIAAIQAFERPIVLLAGGSDKGVDLTEFAAAIASKVKAVALMGETAEQLGQSIASFASTTCRWLIAEDFAGAFGWSVEQSEAGDVVLLSPGCASFGWFESFADRGERFRAAVNDLSQLS